MVATHILLTQRTEALESLTEALSGLAGADPERVVETAERARGGHVGADYMSALYLAEIARVLQSQQERIRELEAAQQTKASGATAGKRKK